IVASHNRNLIGLAKEFHPFLLAIYGVQHPLTGQSPASLPAQSLATLGPAIGSGPQFLGLVAPSTGKAFGASPSKLPFAPAIWSPLVRPSFLGHLSRSLHLTGHPAPWSACRAWVAYMRGVPVIFDWSMGFHAAFLLFISSSNTNRSSLLFGTSTLILSPSLTRQRGPPT